MLSRLDCEQPEKEEADVKIQAKGGDDARSFAKQVVDTELARLKEEGDQRAHALAVEVRHRVERVANEITDVLVQRTMCLAAVATERTKVHMVAVLAPALGLVHAARLACGAHGTIFSSLGTLQCSGNDSEIGLVEMYIVMYFWS